MRPKDHGSGEEGPQLGEKLCWFGMEWLCSSLDKSYAGLAWNGCVHHWIHIETRRPVYFRGKNHGFWLTFCPSTDPVSLYKMKYMLIC